MEFLETQDPEKRKLIEASDRHKQELHRQVVLRGAYRLAAVIRWPSCTRNQSSANKMFAQQEGH